MAIKYYLTVSSGNYTIETTEGCGFSGSCANLACAFDDSKESVRITDKAWRNWMPILDATADEIETDGEDLSYSELIAYLQTIMTSGGGGGGGGDSGLQLGETSTTAYRGDRGKTAYNHAQLTTGNPHNVSKSDVGLGNVDNTSDLNKPVSSAMQTALSGKASSSHSHSISDVTNLQSTLSGKFEETESGGSGIAPYLCEIKATISGGSLSFASDQVENLRKMFASMYSENKARHICVLTITGGSTTPLTLCTVDLRSYSSTGGSAKFVNTMDYTEILITYSNNAVTSTIDKMYWVGTTAQYNALSSESKNSGKPFFTTD